MVKLRILIIADEVWNDQLFGNNVLSNWFQGFDADLAEIYCSPGTPRNDCCENYFQVTDLMMVKSLFGKPAGSKFYLSIEEMKNDQVSGFAEPVPARFYRFMKSISNESIRVVRDLIWLAGRYDTNKMHEFINEFQPNIIFCPRLLTPKLLRLERVVYGITNVPFVAFTADDEASLLQINYSPIYWIRRLIFRSAFRKHIKLYQHYFTFSQEQADEYKRTYGIPSSTLFKSGHFENKFSPKNHSKPIKLVYAGRLYCNRWKTLAYIGEALRKINSEEIKMTLDIYTQEIPTKKQLKVLSETEYLRLNGSVDPSDLIEIYKRADIALHVESLDKKYRYATRVSFSTKIIDLMASSCAIMAIAWERHAGYQYLKSNDAAFCIPEYEGILPALQQICDNPQTIDEYARRAWNCGRTNHNKDLIQKSMKKVFSKLVVRSENI